MNDPDTSAVVAEMSDVLALMRTQAALYERLDALTANQRSLIAADDTSALLEHLSRRKKIVEALSQIAGRLAPVRHDWSAVRRRCSEGEGEEADRLIADVEIRLRRMIQRDEEDVRVLSARKQAVSQTLRAAHTTGQALTAYRAPVMAVPGSNILDESSA